MDSILRRLTGQSDLDAAVRDREVCAAFTMSGVVAADPVQAFRARAVTGGGVTTMSTLDWADPTRMLEVSGLARWEFAREWEWLRGVVHPWDRSPVRVMHSTGDPLRELPVEANHLLLRTPGVASVVGPLSEPRRRPAPPWTWPLRVATGARWHRSPLRRRGTPASWWQRLVTPVPTAGRWATASLALLDADEVWAAADVTPDLRLRAAAVLVVAPGVTRFMAMDLRQLARSFSADLIAVVPETNLECDDGPDNYLIELMTRLSHNVPLDAALHGYDPSRYDDSFDRPRDEPLILARRDRLDQLQLTATIDRLTRAALDSADEDRRGRAKDIMGLVRSRAFEQESGLASNVAEWSTTDQEVRRREVDRYLLADLRDGTDDQPVSAPRPHADYQLAVRIATPAAPLAREVPVFPAQELFPDDGPDSVELTVVVTSRALSAGDRIAGDRAVIDLPRTGNSGTARFPIRTGPVGSVVDLRVVVLQRKRIVQTGLFRAEIGSDLPPSFTPEAAIRPADVELEFNTEHDAVLIFNHTDIDVPTTTAISASGVETVSADEIAGAIAPINALLNRLVDHPAMFEGNSPANSGYQNTAFRDLVIELARRGRSLHDALFGPIGVVSPKVEAELKAARRISVLSVKPTSAYPLELVYDLPIADGIGAGPVELCPHAPTPAGADGCPSTCKSDHSGSVVCPFGFWGLRKVIERHVGGLSPSGAGRYRLAVPPDVERFQVSLSGGLAAAADRADDNDATVWTTAAAALSGTFQLAGSWLELADKARELRRAGRPADVLLLVTHTHREPEGIRLEIGAGDTYPLDRSWAPLVLREASAFQDFAAGQRANPLVMVLGCGTAGTGSDMYSAPTRFLAEGAPAVVASITNVLGRHIVPVGVRLIEGLRAASRAGGSGSLLGDAMLATRRRCVLEGNAAVLALVSFGDTDWQLAPADDG